MGTFTETNVPGGSPGASARAAIEYAKAYELMLNKLVAHINRKVGINDTNEEGVLDIDPHGLKAYIDNIENKAKNTANSAKSIANMLEGILAGDKPEGVSSAQYLVNILGSSTDLISVIKTLLNRITALEKELNTLSLIQFDNVPIGAGIRWYRDTLPADGTYVWANGQTLYGVNQNFPELATVWELGSSDNVVVPKEDHTIFKVRKATKRIEAIQHAYIDAAAGEDHPSGNDSQEGD